MLLGMFLFCFFFFACVVSAGIKAQAATIEQGSVEAEEKVESPVVIVTGASRGIGKAIALTLGKAGCKVGRLPNRCRTIYIYFKFNQFLIPPLVL